MALGNAGRDPYRRTMGVTVVIPCFNEATKIAGVLAQMPRLVAGHAVTVVVVDDGSTDTTIDEIETCLAALERRAVAVELLRQGVNRGKGAAMRLARDHIAAGSFDALVWMDSDGQHLPESIQALVLPVLDGRADLCVGSRYLHTGETNPAPLNRRLVRSATIAALRRRTGISVTDPYSGFRCFSPRAASALTLVGDRYEAELESFLSVAQAGMRYLEIPIARVYGPATSKMGYGRGRLRGRASVIAGYVRTIHRASNTTPHHTKAPTHG